MAKQRKQKQRDGKADATPSGPSVTLRYQKLCLAIDLLRKRLVGYSELTVVTPKEGVIGLNAHGLSIEQVLVNGVPAKYELLQHNISPEQFAPSVQERDAATAEEVADAAYSKYSELLQAELQPSLLIYPPDSALAGEVPAEPSMPAEATDGPSESQQTGLAKATDGPSEGLTLPALGETEAANTGETKVVRIDYTVEDPGMGAHFVGETFHVNNQLRHARCWFPCIDSSLQRCSYDMEFTVDSQYIAVSNGKLLHQVTSADTPHLRTFVYNVSIPTAASFMSLVVAPFVVVPDRHNASISHFCMPGEVAKLQCSISFFHAVFSFFEEYLGAQFPYGSYKHVFIDSESAVAASFVSASMVTLSSHLLVNELIIDQALITRIRLAQALAQQWFGVFITPETSSDAWLLEGLAGFMGELYVKHFVGNNEACYRQYKANEAVCMVDVKETPPLCLPAALGLDLYGTEKQGALGQIRAWKAVAVVQMLEKQMGPEPFRKILQRIILRAQDPAREWKTLSTKEFRHFAMKLGNLERPFLKEFFPRWVESQGCPRLRLGFAYNKRRNMVELAVQRGATDSPDMVISGKSEEQASKNVHTGWPGMMSVRIHELDGMYDHPSLPMAGDSYQLLELMCHSKLAGRRIQRPKKGTKGDAADEIADVAASQNLESPLLWLRADPGMEYLAEIHLYQSEQMWINQLEKERDVAGQILAISELRALARPSFAVVNALNSCLVDHKVFCRVRIEAASALASTATETTNFGGLAHLIKFFKSCCFDPQLGLPRSNNFGDFAQYFVLEAIPGAVAAVRGSDGKSPPEGVELVLHILKHNDNSGNAFSDVFWLASVIESVGNFEYGQQSMKTLCKLLKQIDHFLQYDRIMPSYNGVLTISCVRTLTKLALKISNPKPMKQVQQLLLPLRDAGRTQLQVRVAALQALLDIECQWRGLDAALRLAVDYITAEPSLRVQRKVMAHMLKSCVMTPKAVSVPGSTLVTILKLLETRTWTRNVELRHDTFCLLQVLAGRSATLYRPEGFRPLKADHPAVTTPTVSTPQAQNAKPSAKPDPAQNRSEAPRRIRLIPVTRPGIPKDAEPTPTNSASSSGGGRQSDDKKVGKVTLRLKPSPDLLYPAEPPSGQEKKKVIARSLSMPGGLSSTSAGALSPAFVPRNGPSHSEENLVIPHAGEEIPITTDTLGDGSDCGQGMMGLLTAESPVRGEAVAVGAVAVGAAAGDVGNTSYQAGLDLELGEIQEHEAAADQTMPSQALEQGTEGPLAINADKQKVASAVDGVEKKKEKKEKRDKEKKDKEKREKKDKEKKHKDKEKKHKEKREKKDKKEKKRKHHKEEHAGAENGNLAATSPDLERSEKRRRREEREGDDVKKVDSITEAEMSNGASFVPSYSENKEVVKTSIARPKPHPPEAGGEGKSNINAGDGVLRLKIKKSKANL